LTALASWLCRLHSFGTFWQTNLYYRNVSVAGDGLDDDAHVEKRNRSGENNLYWQLFQKARPFFIQTDS